MASSSAHILSVAHGEHFGRPIDRATVTRKCAERNDHQERPAAHHSPSTADSRVPAHYVKQRGTFGSAPMSCRIFRSNVARSFVRLQTGSAASGGNDCCEDYKYLLEVDFECRCLARSCTTSGKHEWLQPRAVHSAAKPTTTPAVPPRAAWPGRLRIIPWLRNESDSFPCRRQGKLISASECSCRQPTAGQTYFLIKVDLPNSDSIRSTATLAVLFCRSSAGFSSITSSEARRPVSAIISMQSWASR